MSRVTYPKLLLPWATTPAPHKFAKFPPLEDYQGLMEKYLERVKKA